MNIRYFKYLVIGFLGLLFAGCSDLENINPNQENGQVRIEGDKVILTSTFDVPEFRQVSTRAFSEAPSLKALNLYIVEFIDNGDPLTNTLSTVYRPSKEVADATNSTVTYTVTLNKTDQPRILHLIAVADDDLQIPYGVESSVIPGLTGGPSATGEGVDAYWRRLEFKAGYCTLNVNENNQEVWEANSDLQDKLINKNVKLVRNFAKVTVGIDANATYPSGMSFDLEGFLIVNTPLKGSFAPYSSANKEFPEFLDANDNPLPYQTVAAYYRGFSPANTTLGNEVTSEDAPEIPTQNLTPFSTTENGVTKNWNCLPAEYLYERPFNSISRTFIIIKGKYYNSITDRDPKSSYYKLDLGANDNNGIFRYFGLLRNFNYFIRITGVHTAGYESASAAAEGTVYNNISFDIDTDHLMNMSDGTDIIKVNFTTAVITEDNQTLDFRYSYKSEITGTNNGYFNNSAATFIDLKPGSVISSVTPTDPNTATDSNISGTIWRNVKIACKNPVEGFTNTQEFTIVNKNTGLGRTITLVSHLKWDYENVIEYANIWENYPNTYQGLKTETTPTSLNNATFANLCGTNVGSQFTIFFDIPDKIPEALFPLVFTIESNLQGLENEPMGTIVVSPGPSLFEENKGENRIQYNKSVTWTEYNSALRMDVRDDNGTRIGDPEDGPVIHRVRCRFRTIETVANNTAIRVKISNLNFNDTEVHFTRTTAANNLRGPGLVKN